MILFSLLMNMAFANDVTPQNWKTHPEITEIRLLRKAVEKGVLDPTWTIQKENLSACAGQYVKDRSIARDAPGIIRRYKAEGTENGISFWTTQIYGEGGKLRFVHLKLTHEESDSTTNYTSFLDVHGARLFEHLQRVTDDEKRLPSQVPDKYLVKRPKKNLEATAQCATP